MAEPQGTFLATGEECICPAPQQKTTGESPIEEQEQNWMNWSWDYLKSGWGCLLKLFKWGWGYLSRACYLLLFRCNFTCDNEWLLSECDSMQRSWRSYVGDRVPPNILFYRCLKRCFKTFRSDWQTLTGDRNPLASLCNLLGRCCQFLRSCWHSVTGRYRRPSSSSSSDFWHSVVSCGGGASKLSLNLVSLCLEPLARCWHKFRSGCGCCLRGCSILAVCYSAVSWLRGFLSRSLTLATRSCSSLLRCCGTVFRLWSFLTKCCHFIAQSSNLIKRR